MNNLCKKILILMEVFLLSTFLYAEINDVVYAAADKLELKASAKTNAKSLKVVSYGTKLIIAEEGKNWILVKDDESGIKGWVPYTSVSKRKLAAKKTSLNTSEIALAGKGVDSSIEKAFSEAYDEHFAEVDKMENNSISYSSAKLEAFIAEGKLNNGGNE